MSFISTALQLVNLGAGTLALGTGIKDTINPQQNKDLKRSQELAFQQSQFIQDLAEASINPSDPRYQALIAESRDADFQNLLLGHQQQRIQAERQHARGGLSTVSDRQDEAHQRSFRALDYPGVANERREAARGALERAGRMAGVGMSGISGELALDREGLGANQRAGSLGAIGDATEQIERSLLSFEGLSRTPTNLGGGRAGGVGGANVSPAFRTRLPGE